MSSSRIRKQKTLAMPVSLSGVGVHGGQPVRMTIWPADPDTGIVFHRTGLGGRTDVEIPALSGAVGATDLCTVLGDPRGVHVATVEHLLAGLFGLGIDNAIVEIDGAEVPVMDGSAAAFVEAIDHVGTATQKAPKRFLKVLKPVRVEIGSAWAEFRPFDGYRFDIAIDYDCPVIGRGAMDIALTPQNFRRDIAGARTFGNLKDVDRLRAAGFARGSSLENSVVIADGAVLNPEGLRYPDEFVRHKVLDAIGDLALAGAPLRGLYRSYRGGHKLNAAALSALLADHKAWRLVTDSPERETRAESRGELGAGLLQPVFAPEVA